MGFNPDHSDLHYDEQLADFAVDWMQNRDNFVHHQAAPFVDSDKESGVYAQYDRADLWRNEVRVRRPGTRPAEGGYDITRPAYSCVTYDIMKKVPDEHQVNASAPLDPLEKASRYCAQQHLINMEQIWASTFFTTSVWSTDLVGAASGPTTGEFLQWDVATANPATQIGTYQQQMGRDTGMPANTLICGWNSWLALRDNDELRDMYKHTTSGPLTTELVAQALELDQVLVGRSTRTSSVEGATDAFTLAVGTNDALLAYVDPDPDDETMTSMVTFRWTGFTGANEDGIAVATTRGDTLEFSDVVVMFSSFVPKVVTADMGVFFQTTNTL